MEERLFIRKSCVNTWGDAQVHEKSGTDSRLVKMESEDSVGCLLAIRCSRLWLWLFGLDCRCSRVTGADVAGQLNADRRGGWRWGGVSSPWDPPSTGHWETRQGESFSHLDEEVERKILVVFHLLFIWMLSLLLVCLLSWNSVISLILKFKYINFYLVYRYLFSFSVGELVCECVWGCVMHVAYCMRTSEGMWSLKKKTRWCTGSVDGLRNSRKPFDSFHWVSFGLCFVNQCHCYEV